MPFHTRCLGLCAGCTRRPGLLAGSVQLDTSGVDLCPGDRRPAARSVRPQPWYPSRAAAARARHSRPGPP
eukprot:311300-Prymnesium_polylepis.1